MVMIVLVLFSVVGLAAYSRVVMEKTSVVSEQKSSESSEVVDAMINLFADVSADELIGSLDGVESLKIDSRNDLKEYLTQIGVDDSYLDEVCGEDVAFIVTVEPGDEEYLEVRDGMALDLVLGENSQALNPNCDLSLEFEPRGVESVGLVVHKIYGKDYPNPEYKTLYPGDMFNYCVYSGAFCNSQEVTSSSSWVPFSSFSAMSVHLNDIVEGYSLDKIRLLVVGGTLGVRSSLSDSDCAGNFDPTIAQVSIKVDMQGVSEEENVLVSNKENMISSDISDYEIYSDNDLLQHN